MFKLNIEMMVLNIRTEDNINAIESPTTLIGGLMPYFTKYELVSWDI